MNVDDVYLEFYGRIASLVRVRVDGLDHASLATSPVPGANPIGWLVWHLTRVQDHHVSELLVDDQLWTRGGWGARFERDAAPKRRGFRATPPSRSQRSIP